MKQIDFTLGADPEFFLVSKETGKVVSAHDIVPGTKEEPVQIDDNGTKVLADGLAVEFNINPAKSSKEFVHNIKTAIASIKKNLPPHVQICRNSAAEHIDVAYLNSLPETTTQLGCMPDISAYSWEEKIPEENPEKPPFRTVAGHLHIGYIPPEKQNWKPWNIFMGENPKEFCKTITMVSLLDGYMGIPFDYFDKNKNIALRRTMYGQFGSFRHKPYGVEYRSLSNYWLWNDMLLNKIWDTVNFCLNVNEHYSKSYDEQFQLSGSEAPFGPTKLFNRNFEFLSNYNLVKTANDLMGKEFYKDFLTKNKKTNHPLYEVL